MAPSRFALDRVLCPAPDVQPGMSVALDRQIAAANFTPDTPFEIAG